MESGFASDTRDEAKRKPPAKSAGRRAGPGARPAAPRSAADFAADRRAGAPRRAPAKRGAHAEDIVARATAARISVRPVPQPVKVPTDKAAARKPADESGERIQKALASAGIASRRAVENLIAEGRITVNGEPAQAGQRLHAKDRVVIDGQPHRWNAEPEAMRVLLYKKRVGELVTRSDPEGRRTVFRKLPELISGRWIAVGRLDINTSGLLLLTNHGELARRLTHPSFELTREYAVRTLGEIGPETIDRLKRGVELEDGPAHFESMKPMANAGDYDEEGGGPTANRWFHVVVREGRNRLVRRLIESQNLQVSRLIRIAYGPIQLGGGIRSGSYREADKDELAAIRAAVGLETSGRGPAPGRSGKRPRR